MLRYPRLHLLLSLVAAGVVFTGCSNGEGDADGSGDAASAQRSTGDPDAPAPGSPVEMDREDGGTTIIYAVRAEVTRLPDGMNDLMARHEAIPEFVQGERGPDGEPVLGMDVMNMPFPTPEGYDLLGVEVGDKLMIEFAVQYAADGSLEAFEVVSHEELPADTELNFSPQP